MQDSAGDKPEDSSAFFSGATSQPPPSPQSPTTGQPKSGTAGQGALRREAALDYNALGLTVVPFLSGTKRPAVKLEQWRNGYSEEKIRAHWAHRPLHDVACVVGDKLIVLDADTPAALAALREIERRFGVEPKLVVKTPRGEHHYLRLTPGTHARSDSHSTADFPERIDVRTGNAFAKLPPDPGREVIRCDIATVADLGQVDQDFVDAVFAHNGRAVPRPYAGAVARAAEPPSPRRMAQLGPVNTI